MADSSTEKVPLTRKQVLIMHRNDRLGGQIAAEINAKVMEGKITSKDSVEAKTLIALKGQIENNKKMIQVIDQMLAEEDKKLN